MDILSHKSMPEARAGEKGGCYRGQRMIERVDGKVEIE